MKFTRIITLFITLLAFVLTGCNILGNIPTRVGLELIAEGFTSPVALVTPRDESDRLFVVDQVGMIWILSQGKRIEIPFLDLRDRIVELNAFYDERGLLGLAFHPDFATNGRFYVSYSAPLQAGLSSSVWDHTTYISEFTVSADDPNQADPASERVLMALHKPGYNYEAGHLAFGPDGYLYIATGDSVRDPASEAGQYAQDPYSLLGKILRIDVNKTGENGEPYAIPADNPLVDGSGSPEVFAYGFRNPYRFSFDVFDSSESRLFVVDVGQAMMEEVNLVMAGGNYGWPIREGNSCFNMRAWNQPLKTCPTEDLIDPIIAYTHQGDLSAIIGGTIYRGQVLPSLYEGYVFGDWGRGNGHLFVAHPPGTGTGLWKITEIEVELSDYQTGIGQLIGIGQDENGELYLLTKDPGMGPVGESGRLYKLIPP
jgi:glucose/arabinose dehydrogenase